MSPLENQSGHEAERIAPSPETQPEVRHAPESADRKYARETRKVKSEVTDVFEDMQADQNLEKGLAEESSDKPEKSSDTTEDAAENQSPLDSLFGNVAKMMERYVSIKDGIQDRIRTTIGPMVPVLMKMGVALPLWLQPEQAPDSPQMAVISKAVTESGRTMEKNFKPAENDAATMRSLIKMHHNTEKEMQAVGRTYTFDQFIKDAVIGVDSPDIGLEQILTAGNAVTKEKHREAEAMKATGTRPAKEIPDQSAS